MLYLYIHMRSTLSFHNRFYSYRPAAKNRSVEGEEFVNENKTVVLSYDLLQPPKVWKAWFISWYCLFIQSIQISLIQKIVQNRKMSYLMSPILWLSLYSDPGCGSGWRLLTWPRIPTHPRPSCRSLSRTGKHEAAITDRSATSRNNHQHSRIGEIEHVLTEITGLDPGFTDR